MAESYPRCNHAPGCVSCKDGHCMILKNSHFEGKPCPFHKTKAQCELENRLVLERLIAEERLDLLEKYYGGANYGC